MMLVRFPAILCITTSSLLKSTRPGGLFHELLASCKIIIGDEASQILEPAFAAMISRFPSARHGVMAILLDRDVPLAPLVTTFRAHPSLNSLPNRLVYNGTLVSGTRASDRALLVRRITLPNPRIPFVLVNVSGSSRLSASQSHSNEEEARSCVNLVCALIAKGIAASGIAIITYYKDQQRLLQSEARRLGVTLHTVDTVQGREMDIVIILTTRSEVDASTGEFLDDRRRLNVVITRCRHGEFVLDNLRALQTLSSWNPVIQWAREKDVIVNDSTLPDLFASLQHHLSHIYRGSDAAKIQKATEEAVEAARSASTGRAPR